MVPIDVAAEDEGKVHCTQKSCTNCPGAGTVAHCDMAVVEIVNSGLYKDMEELMQLLRFKKKIFMKVQH